MKSKNIISKEEKQGKLKTKNSNNILKKIKSDYFIRKFFECISKRKSLEIIKYNKNIQKRININTNQYKAYSEQYSSI